MKAFKAVILPLLILIAVFLPSAEVAARAATPKYAYADAGSEAYFCAEKNAESALFIIPQTYCVEILAEEGLWYYVKYAADAGIYRAVYGYCLKSEVIPTDEPLENLYLNLPVNLIFRTDEVNSLLPPLQITVTSAYYGEYTLGKSKLAYVYCNEKFGYAPQTVTDYPLNELPAPVSGSDVTPPEAGDDSTLITVIVIAVIASGAIIVLYFSSKKKGSEDGNNQGRA